MLGAERGPVQAVVWCLALGLKVFLVWAGCSLGVWRAFAVLGQA